MSDPVEFVNARLDEAEKELQPLTVARGELEIAHDLGHGEGVSWWADFDLDRAFRDIEAKRRIINRPAGKNAGAVWQLMAALDLAAIWNDHPDYEALAEREQPDA